MSLALSFDGSFEGLLSAVFWAYASHSEVEDLCPEQNLQLRLGQDTQHVPTNMGHAQRVARAIKRQLGPCVWKCLLYAGASDNAQRGNSIYRFIRFALASPFAINCTGCPRKGSCSQPCRKSRGAQLLDQWANQEAGPVLELQRHVVAECEKVRQFVRFQHSEEGLWYARCNPNANVLPLVMGYFSARFNVQSFVIFDQAHKLAGLSSSGQWRLLRTSMMRSPSPAPEEAQMQQAWKNFYQALSVESRYNPELRQHFIPQRFWAQLTELQP